MTIPELDVILSTINKVKDIPEYSIKDKLDALVYIVDTVKNVADEQKDEILKTCRYCKHCKQYYTNESWKVERKFDVSEESVWDPDPFAEPRSRRWQIEFDECTCPVGHKVRENIDHLYVIYD